MSTYKGHKIHISSAGRRSCGGYPRVSINSKWYYVHRLVAEEHVPNPLNLPFVDHIDMNPLNNDPSNLRWVSISTNTLHGNKTRRMKRNLTSRYKGVSLLQGKWRCRFRGKIIASFRKERCAAKMYNIAARLYDRASVINVF